MYDVLKSQFEETKQTLIDVERNIRRITGRDPSQFTVTPSGDIRWRNDGKQNFLQRKRPLGKDFTKDRAGEEEETGEVDEESAEEDSSPSKKPSLQSRVVANLKDVKTRRATIEEQKRDRRILARNRRMFGMMLGTLQKFQSEESRRQVQLKKKAEIDKKIEEAAEKDKELMKKEKEQLFLMRREKQTQIRCLEKKLEIAEVHEVWEQNQKHLVNFIQTGAQPQIMYLPAKHNAKSLKCLEETKEKITALIQTNAERVQKELEEIEELYRKDDGDAAAEEVGDKENIGPAKDTAHEGEENANCDEMEEQSNDAVDAASEDRTAEGQTETQDDTMGDESRTEAKTAVVDGATVSDKSDSEAAVEKLADQEDFEPIYDE